MSEVNNKNKYLDLAGLVKYDGLIKTLINKGNADLADAIAALNAKIGNLEIEGSDDKSLAESINNIYTSIAEIVEAQGALEAKDGELENAINNIIGDLDSSDGVDAVATLVEISNKLAVLDASVSKNTTDIADVDSRVTVLEGVVEDLGKIEGGDNLASIVTKVNKNVEDIATLNGEGDGSVKKTAADAAAQALSDAKADAESKYQLKGDYEEAGAAAAAETAAKEYADGLAGANTTAIGGLGDRIGVLEGITHATEVKYEDGYVKLYDKDGNAIGKGFDASDFVVDGMLESVSFKEVEGVKTNILVFTFNTDHGSNEVEVDFSKYVDTYHADETSLALDSTTNTFSIKEVAANKTKLNNDITIAGGPLANNIAESGDEWPWTDEAGNKIIPQGKSMEEILTGLFLKVVNGTVKWGTASWSPTIANPTVTLSSNGPVEVGSTVTIKTLTEGAVDAKKRSVTCTCSEGHFLADEDGNPTGSHVSGNKTISVDASISGSASLSCTWNGVACGASDDLVVVEGSNKVIANQSGQTAQCEALPTTKVFASTNTKSVLSNVSATFSEDKPDDKPLTSSGNDTINAYYPIYTNGKQGTQGSASSESALVENDGTKLSLVADNTYFYVNFAPMIDGGTGYRLLVKSGKTITEAKALNTLNNTYEVDMKSSFVKASESVKKSSGGTDIDYDVYEAKGSAGANALRFKID